MERHYEGSRMSFLEPRAQSMSLQIIFFLPFIVDLTFGKILNYEYIEEESQQVPYLNS